MYFQIGQSPQLCRTFLEEFFAPEGMAVVTILDLQPRRAVVVRNVPAILSRCAKTCFISTQKDVRAAIDEYNCM